MPPRGVHESAAVGAKKSMERRVQNEALMRSHFPGKELCPVAKLLLSNLKTIIQWTWLSAGKTHHTDNESS